MQSINNISVNALPDHLGLARGFTAAVDFLSSIPVPDLGFLFANKSTAPNSTVTLIDQFKGLVSSWLLKASWKLTFKVIFFF